MEKEDNSLISRITKDYNLDEEIKKHPGFGKPLPKNLLSGDIYTNFLNTAKEAGYLPSWIELQKNIRNHIAQTIKMIEQKDKEDTIKSSIEKINEQIKKYNNECPPPMQRGRISLESIKKQYKNWE